MSWVGEVIADSSGQWTRNGCRYATKDEAMSAVLELSWRWTSVRGTRVTESGDPVNVAWNPETQKTEFL